MRADTALYWSSLFSSRKMMAASWPPVRVCSRSMRLVLLADATSGGDMRIARNTRCVGRGIATSWVSS